MTNEEQRTVASYEKRARARIEFLLIKDQVQEQLGIGYSLRAMHRFFTANGQIHMAYNTFRYYAVQNFGALQNRKMKEEPPAAAKQDQETKTENRELEQQNLQLKPVQRLGTVDNRIHDPIADPKALL